MNIAVDDDLCTDDGVDVRGSVKGHKHGREALKGMLPYNIESHSRVFELQMIPSTRSDGEAQPFKPTNALFSLTHSHVRFVNCGNPAEWVQM